jgi:hypothetical protein
MDEWRAPFGSKMAGKNGEKRTAQWAQWQIWQSMAGFKTKLGSKKRKRLLR